MRIESVIRLVNSMIKDEKYHKARNLIINEWDRLTEARNYQLLTMNAKQFIKVLQEEKDRGIMEGLTDSEKQILNLINRYVNDLQLHFARRIYSEHIKLLEKEVAQKWLTSDARYIYQAWKKSVKA